MKSNSNAKLFIWTELRSRSTVLLRCLSNTKNVVAFFEPCNYVALSGPSEERLTEVRINWKIIKEYPSWTRAHVKELIEFHHKQSHVVVKDFADGLGTNFNWIPKDASNIILIRHPAKCVDSILKMTDDDVGFNARVECLKARMHDTDHAHKGMLQLYEFLKENNRPVAVVDSNDLSLNSNEVVKFICEFSGLPFTEDMLHWKSLQADTLPENWIVPEGFEDLRVIYNPCRIASISTNFKFTKDPNDFDVKHLHPIALEYVKENLPAYEALLKCKHTEY